MTFQPRVRFPNLATLTVPRSYFLGHHAAGLERMRGLMGSIDVIIEVRDYRTPLTSRNPLFEQVLGGLGSSSSRARLIVYTKRDLGCDGGGGSSADRARERLITRWASSQSGGGATSVLFSSANARTDIRQIVDFCRRHHADTAATSSARSWLFGTRVLVVGMPNVGKSTLVNALRRCGVGGGKAVRTGDQPGVTRRVATAVKIAAAGGGADDVGGGGVYVVDTPGVFVPYVADAESMLKLAACGNVRDGLVPAVTLADYVLFHVNRHGEHARYGAWHDGPTNDIGRVLAGLARRQGRFKRRKSASAGEPELDYEAAALQFVHRWRVGDLGRFVLDDVDEDILRQDSTRDAGGSWNQARKAIKLERKMKGLAKSK